MNVTILDLRKSLMFPLKVGASYMIVDNKHFKKGVLMWQKDDNFCFHLADSTVQLHKCDIITEFYGTNKVYDAFHYTAFEVGNINDLANAFLKLAATIPYDMFEKANDQINELVKNGKVKNGDTGVLYMSGTNNTEKNPLFYIETEPIKIDDKNSLRIGFTKK